MEFPCLFAFFPALPPPPADSYMRRRDKSGHGRKGSGKLDKAFYGQAGNGLHGNIYRCCSRFLASVSGITFWLFFPKGGRGY